MQEVRGKERTEGYGEEAGRRKWQIIYKREKERYKR